MKTNHVLYSKRTALPAGERPASKKRLKELKEKQRAGQELTEDEESEFKTLLTGLRDVAVLESTPLAEQAATAQLPRIPKK